MKTKTIRGWEVRFFPFERGSFTVLGPDRNAAAMFIFEVLHRTSGDYDLRPVRK